MAVAGALMDVDALLGPVSEEAPCGPNLEYDVDFHALEVASRGKPEQVIGEARVAAVPPIWSEIRDLAQALLARTKDLRVAVLWTRAAMGLSGLGGLRDGLRLTRGLLETYWDDVHPQIDPADQDPGFRMNALAGLVDPETFLPEVRHAVLVEVPRAGRILVADVLVAAGKLQPVSGESSRTPAEVEALLREAAGEPAALEASLQASEFLTELQKLLLDKVGSDRMPDLQPLRDLLAPVAEACRTALGATGEVPQAGAPPETPGGAAEVVRAAAHGAIRSREDAIHMLERVCEYLERSEPANPAPLLIRRARRLMTMNFMEIIEDLTPDSAAAVKALGGIKD